MAARSASRYSRNVASPYPSGRVMPRAAPAEDPGQPQNGKAPPEIAWLKAEATSKRLLALSPPSRTLAPISFQTPRQVPSVGRRERAKPAG